MSATDSKIICIHLEVARERAYSDEQFDDDHDLCAAIADDIRQEYAEELVGITVVKRRD